MSERLVVAAAITDDLESPRLLLAARRTEPPALAGLWEFPGGKVEEGETEVQALHREILEELGVHVTLGDEVPGPDWGGQTSGEAVPVWELRPAEGTSPRLVLRIWWAQVQPDVDGGIPEPLPLEDHDELRWLEPGKWRDVAWIEADRRIVEALLADAVSRARRAWC